eukprot:6226968-Prymnesium_polylepis.2
MDGTHTATYVSVRQEGRRRMPVSINTSFRNFRRSRRGHGDRFGASRMNAHRTPPPAKCWHLPLARGLGMGLGHPCQ